MFYLISRGLFIFTLVEMQSITSIAICMYSPNGLFRICSFVSKTKQNFKRKHCATEFKAM